MSKCALNAKIEPYLIVASVFKLFQEKKKQKKLSLYVVRAEQQEKYFLNQSTSKESSG